MVILLPYRFRAIVLISILLIIVSGFLIFRDSKPKTEYSKLSGTISYYDKTYGELPYRHLGKFRYLKINNYPYAFELYIGKDFGDFKPDFENLDGLKAGDSITIYGYESNDEQQTGINRNAQFIDKNNQSYFKRGSKSRIIGLSIIGSSLGLLLIGFILMKQGKLDN